MSSDKNSAKVQKYTRNLISGEDPKHALKRLFDLDAPSKVFHEAETRNHLKKYLNDPEIGKYAARLKEKLKGQKKELKAEKAEKERKKRDRVHDEDTSSEERPPKQMKTETLSAAELFSQAMIGTKTNEAKLPKQPVDYSKFKVSKKRDVVVKQELNRSPSNTEYESASSSSFRPSSSTQSMNSHPEAKNMPSREYAPSMHSVAPKIRPVAASKVTADENMFKPRKERQKVFAGRRKKIITEVPSLLSMCQDSISANLNLVGFVGWTPYHLLKSSLTRCNDDQLRKILDMNPNISADADELFHERVRLEFPKYAEQKKGDEWTWRELYDRLVNMKASKDKAKLEKLTTKIGRTLSKHDTGRRTMVIDAAHTNVRRRGAVIPTTVSTTRMTATPSASELSQARKNLPSQGRSQLNALQAPIRSAVQAAKPVVKKNTAPLMAKVKKMLRR